VPAVIPRGARHAGMDEQAELVDEAAAEQRADQGPAAVHPHHLRALALTQRAQRRGEIHALRPGHERGHVLGPGVRGRRGGM
jgi:hypothetical protein